MKNLPHSEKELSKVIEVICETFELAEELFDPPAELNPKENIIRAKALIICLEHVKVIYGNRYTKYFIEEAENTSSDE